MEDSYKKRDNLINVVFALIKICDGDATDEDSQINLDDLEDLVEKINMVSEYYPFISEYDKPDLSIDSIKQNEHVDYVSLNNVIVYNMDRKEAELILERNEDLVILITNIANIEDFNKNVMDFTNNKVAFECSEPNGEYSLGYIIDAEGRKENKLFTDGTITMLSETDSLKEFRVDNATYAIKSAYVEGDLVSAVIKSKYVSPEFLNFLMFEVRDFYCGLHNNYEESKTKPRVLRKKVN